ncbi:Multi antimicrobial extrusion protein [Dillenia turbinata]|uniref:Protein DETOXIFICATION n=1 Tax=Dillenia turbinata TaxID=194707 RepID=A0AAN8V2D5_9MAGN
MKEQCLLCLRSLHSCVSMCQAWGAALQAEKDEYAVKQMLCENLDLLVVEVPIAKYGSRIERKGILEEIKKQMRLAGPLIGVGILQFSLQVISVMFVGHLGELPLSGATMATSFACVTGFSFLIGVTGALDTFCGQSFGAKEYRMLGIYTQRAMLISVLVCIPLSLIWANTRTILLAFGQDEDIAREAGVYARYLIPGMFPYGLIQCLVRFLQTQSIVFPMIVTSGFTTCLHLLVCWTLVVKSSHGSKGAALANAISYWSNFLSLALYIKFSPSCAKTWKGFSMEAFRNVPSYLRLAIPSTIMVCLKMWSFEMIVLLAGLLPNPQLETSVLSIRISTSNEALYDFCVYSTRVSNELGAGHPQAARLAVQVVRLMAITEGIIVGLLLILARHILGHAYTSETQVINYLAVMMPLLAITTFLDGLQGVLTGVARGCGWQKIGAIINLGSYYLVGIPFTVVFAFVLHIGGKGLLLGIICALLVQALSLLIITIRTNWDQEAKKAMDRVYDSMISRRFYEAHEAD